MFRHHDALPTYRTELLNGSKGMAAFKDNDFKLIDSHLDPQSFEINDMDAWRSIHTLNPNKKPYIFKKDKNMTTENQAPTFREVYQACFTNGVATSESTSIYIMRAVTTLCKDAHKYEYMVIRVATEKKDYQDTLSQLNKKFFPYGFFSHNLFIGFADPETPESIPDVVINVDSRQSGPTLLMLNIKYLPSKHVDEYLTELKKTEYSPPLKVTTINMIRADGRPNMEHVEFDPSTVYEAHIEFYPFLHKLYPETDNLTVDHIVEDFMKSKANLLLLIGPAGTAKSTLIRSFIRKEHDVLVISSAQVLDSPALPTTFRTKPEKGCERLVTIYEDADIFVAPRDKGNLALSSMLNQLDGIVGNKEKFIISTNLESISKVDKALLRPGRCHKVMQFRLLEGDEINIARSAVGKPPIDELKPLTLSEALHYNEIEIDDRKTAKFGFTP